MRFSDVVLGDPLPWLLDSSDPGVRYLALRDLMDLPDDNPELVQARRLAHTCGPIADVLEAMAPEGYWAKAGAGYSPKYKGTVWSLILLGQLGARIDLDPRIATACGYLLAHTMADFGRFSASRTPSGAFDCLNGNLSWALQSMGCDDPRVELNIEWIARSVTGIGVAPREDTDAPLRYLSANCGPGFACGNNVGLPCAYSAAKVMLALGSWPVERRTPLIQQAIEQGVAFLFSIDPADADWPFGRGNAPSRNWWKLGFPMFYIADLLQVIEALNLFGMGADPRLDRTWQLILDKQDGQGRWPLEYHYSGKTWGDFGARGQPNKWVTLRVLRAIQGA